MVFTGALAHDIAELSQGGGLITEKDLADYEVKEPKLSEDLSRIRDRLARHLRHQGASRLIQTLNILEGFDLRRLGNRSADTITDLGGISPRDVLIGADFLGDPDFSKIPFQNC